MKKITTIVTIMLVMLMLFAGCGAESTTSDSAQDMDKAYTVGIIQFVSHPALDNCYEGIKTIFEESGLNITIDRQVGSDASPDTDCATYANNMVAKKYDMIIAIATPAATSAYAATENTDIPVIFSAVSDPVAAELVASLDNPGDICTGTSDVLDMEAQLKLIKAFQPDVKKIGVIYTTSEVNSITQLANLKDAASADGIEIIASGVQSASDIPATITALVDKVDCLNNFSDNNIVNNLSVVINAANAAGIPVYGSEVEQVKSGCLASVSIDYVALGELTGEMALDVLNGADPSKMPVKTISEATPVVNSDVLSSLNIALPDEYKDAETVTTNK